MAEYLIKKNPASKSWAFEYAKLYLEEGEAEGVRGDGAWIQSCKETGNFKFSGGTAVTFEQNNFCGLGVTKKGVKGHSFDTPRLGIRAQIQHLKGYASSLPLKNVCVDPRYGYINPKGKAPRFEDLAGKWAVPGYDTSKASSLTDAMNNKIGYGFDIISGIEEMKKIVVSDNTKTEVEKPMGYSNSSLINYTKISPNKTSPRNHIIDTITIHCMAGNLTVESCGNVFASTTRKASSNYGIDSGGRIAMYVEEKDRSWASSNSANDNRSVTIEVANDGGAPDWHVSDKAMESLINLVTDICKRNNIKELKWQANKLLIGQVDKQNMTVHKWFAAKACPGDYLYNKHSYIASEVNKRLNSNIPVSSPTTTPSIPTKELYRVRKSWSDTSSQIGAYNSLDNAKANCKSGYYVFDDKGNIVYPVSNQSSSNYSSLVKIGLTHAKNFTGVNDSLNIKKAKGRVLQRALNLDYGKSITEDGDIGTKSKNKLGSHYVKKGEKQYMVTAAEILMYLNNVNPNGVELPGTYGNSLVNATKTKFGGNGQKITASNFLTLIK